MSHGQLWRRMLPDSPDSPEGAKCGVADRKAARAKCVYRLASPDCKQVPFGAVADPKDDCGNRGETCQCSGDFAEVNSISSVSASGPGFDGYRHFFDSDLQF